MKNIDTNRYTCVAVEHSIIEGGMKADGTGEKAPSVSVTLRVVEGPSTGKDIFWYGSLHENAQEFTAKALRAMGWTSNDITTLDGLGDIKVTVQGKESKPYPAGSGKTRQEWSIWEIKQPAPRLADENKASFADRYKALGVATPALQRSEANTFTGEVPESTTMKNGDNVGGPATVGNPF